MKRLIPKLMALLFFVSAGIQMHAQLYNYTDDPTGAPSFAAAHLTGPNLERYKCDTTVGCATGFMSNKFSQNTTFSVYRSSINVTLTPDFGYSLTATTISVDVRRNPKGPGIARLAYSTDGGGTWFTNGTDLTFESSVCDATTTFSWDFGDFTSSNPVIFRIILFGAHGTQGKVQLKNFVVGGETFAADNDGDGYAFDVDCDDTNPDVNPGATEVCNGVDDNCNGDIDEGVMSTFYADADGDAYGDAGSTILGCFPPDGYVTDQTDCNDSDAAINPGATEICNGVDDNCNGDIDEGIDLSIAISPDGVIELCKPDEITLTATGGFDSYQWYKNGVALAGETGISYTTNKPAYYQVEGTKGICSSGLSAVQAVAVYETPSPNIFTPDGLDICPDGPVLIKVGYDAANTYQWYYNGSPLADSTNYKIFTGVTGDYYCVITAGVCTSTSPTVTVINSCRLGENENIVRIYPNPAKSEFTIALSVSDLSDADATIQIADITGRIIYSSASLISNGNMQASVSLPESIPAGIYFVTVQAGQLKWNERITLIK